MKSYSFVRFSVKTILFFDERASCNNLDKNMDVLENIIPYVFHFPICKFIFCCYLLNFQYGDCWLSIVTKRLKNDESYTCMSDEWQAIVKSAIENDEEGTIVFLQGEKHFWILKTKINRWTERIWSTCQSWREYFNSRLVSSISNHGIIVRTHNQKLVKFSIIFNLYNISISVNIQ